MQAAVSDPVNVARAQLAYWSRRDVGNPAKAAEALREFHLAKLERAIRECGPFTAKERLRLTKVLSHPGE